MITKSRVYLALFVAALGFAFYWGMRSQPVPVDLASVARGDLTVDVREEGKTRIREVYDVSAPVSGLLRRLKLKEGDNVRKGKTVVALIEPLSPAFQDIRSMSIARAAVKSAEAGLALAKAELSRVEADRDYAEKEYERNRVLYAKRIIARKVFDQADATRKSAKAAVQSAAAAVEVKKKELESAKASLIQPGKRKPNDGDACCLSIPAPVDGRVLSLKHKSEQVVTAGTPLLEIGDPQDLEIIVDLLSNDAVKVRDGAAALIDGWGGLEALKARVRRVEPAGFTKVSALGIEEQRVRVVLDLEQHDQATQLLGHDYRIYARIKVWEGSNRLLVPLAALFRKGNDWHAFVAANGHAALRKVSIDHRNARFAEVTGGLEPGDTVILHPSDRISDGTQIVARTEL